MPPRETIPLHLSEGTGGDTTPLTLEDYAITPNGFLPYESPLGRLPNPYYAPWEVLVATLPTSLAEKTLRRQADKLPILSTDHLATESEWRRAYVVLAFLTHAYIWGGDTASEVLPPPLSTPLLAVSAHLSLPPIATYASLNLWNFRASTSLSEPPTDPSTLQALHTFTGTLDESWFYIISVAMEARGAPLLPLLLSALHTLHHHQPTETTTTTCITVHTALQQTTQTITHLGHLLDRMDDHCNPQTFYHRIRPFLAGSRNMAAAGLPRGVFYDEGEEKGEWRCLRGGSNGQSSLVQFLDLVLGVEHLPTHNNGDTKSAMSFHEEVREYMPERHRAFLKEVAERYPGGMRKGVSELVAQEMVDGAGLGAEVAAVRDAFEAATRALAGFRGKHLQMVTRYIIIPSRQPNGNTGVNLATASSKLEVSASLPEGMHTNRELTGTGGTALLPFLKQSRDETLQAGQLRVHG